MPPARRFFFYSALAASIPKRQVQPRQLWVVPPEEGGSFCLSHGRIERVLTCRLRGRVTDEGDRSARYNAVPLVASYPTPDPFFVAVFLNRPGPAAKNRNALGLMVAQEPTQAAAPTTWWLLRSILGADGVETLPHPMRRRWPIQTPGGRGTSPTWTRTQRTRRPPKENETSRHPKRAFAEEKKVGPPVARSGRGLDQWRVLGYRFGEDWLIDGLGQCCSQRTGPVSFHSWPLSWPVPSSSASRLT